MSIVGPNSHVNRQYFLFMAYKSGLESPSGYVKTMLISREWEFKVGRLTQPGRATS